MTLYARTGKRAMDVVIATLAIAALAPIHAMCAVMVVVTSGRPIYYSQERVGRDGSAFRLYKFRSMSVGTHEASGGYPTSDMVTPVGRFLRATSLDELPQLMNIAKGDMSLVGPRPALPEQVSRYSSRQRGRLTVRPGLTGLAQIRFRNNAPWSKRIEADLEYVRNVTFKGDVAILARTLPAVFFGTGVVTAGQSVEQVDDLNGQDPPRHE